MRCFIFLPGKTIINLDIVLFQLCWFGRLLKHSPTQVLFLKFFNTNVKCKDLKLGFAVRQSKLESFWMFKKSIVELEKVKRTKSYNL